MLQTRLALIISYVFHPIFLPTYAVLFLMWCNPYYFMAIDSRQGIALLSVILVNSVLLPLIALIILRRSGLIKDLEITDRKERAIPFLIMIFFIFWTYFVVKFRLQLPEILTDVMWGAFLSIMTAYFVNILYMKVSLHAMGMGSLIAIIIAGSFVSLYGLAGVLATGILLAGLVGSSRLILKAHTQREVYYGYLMGFAAQMAAFMM